jgi:hypothetical protein
MGEGMSEVPAKLRVVILIFQLVLFLAPCNNQIHGFVVALCG